MTRASLGLSILGAGLIALLAGLVHLQLVFGAELDEARLRLARAEESMRLLVTAELRAAFAEDRHKGDDLILGMLSDRTDLTDEVFLFSRGGQVLPPLPAPREAPRAMDVIAAFERGAIPLDASPRGERLRLLAALAPRERPSTEEEPRTEIVMKLMAHLAQNRLPPAEELATHLLAVERVAAQPEVDPDVVRGLLGHDMRGHGGKVSGLLEAIVSARGTLPDDDLVALIDRVEDEARRARHSLLQVRRAMAVPAGALELPALPVTTLSFAHVDGRPAVVWSSGPDTRGMWVEAARVERRLTGLRESGLLPSDAVVALPARDVPVDRFEAAITTGSFAEAEATAVRRHRQKSALAGACAVLATIAMGLAAFVVRRRQAFVELKNDFVATVSHELKTPLAAIHLLAETLERKLGGDPKAKDYPRRIVEETERLTFLVENLLSFNRVDKGRWQLQREPTDARELLTDVGVDLERHLGGRPTIEVDVDVPGGLLLDADPELLRLLFSNLIRNGLAYNQSAVPRVRVTAEGPTTFVVEDNGVGIPEADRLRVFEPFVRSSHATTRTRRGSGLGLSLCRRILALHGGELVLAATGPEGSRFVCRFPQEAALGDGGEA